MLGMSLEVIFFCFFLGLPSRWISSSPPSRAAGMASQKCRNAFFSMPMSTNIALSPCSMFLTVPLNIPPTMLASPSRSTSYSSRLLFSRRATLRSSFSELITRVTPFFGSGSLALNPNACLILVIMINVFVWFKFFV